MSCLTFRTTSLFVLFLLLAGSALQTQGFIYETTGRFGVVYFSVKAFILGRIFGVKIFARELRCQCVKVVSHGIPTASIASVDFIAEGPHCIRPEVILTRKDGKQFCLNTTMPWVQKVIQRFTKRTSNL